jgi:hypothetical protein
VNRKPTTRVPMQNMHCMKIRKKEMEVERKAVSDVWSELKPLRLLLRIRVGRWEPAAFFILSPPLMLSLPPLH